MDVRKIYVRPEFSGRLNAATANAFYLDPNISGIAKIDPWLIGAVINYCF